MSLIELSGLTEKILALKSAAAVKIAHLLLKSQTGVIPATVPMLTRILNCSTKGVKSGLDELIGARVLTVGRTGTLIILNLRKEPSARSAVHQSDNPVHEVNSVNPQVSLNLLVSAQPPSEEGLNRKSPKISSKSKNRAPKGVFSSLEADIDDDDDKSTSSSSSLKSAPKPENHTSKCKKDALDDFDLAAAIENTLIVNKTLDTLGMNRDFVFCRVLAATEDLPSALVKKTLDNCIIRLPQSPAYLTKALAQARLDHEKALQADRRETENLRHEIRLGEDLLTGKKLKFEHLDQSKHFKKFASPLYDPLGKYCLIDEEHREEVREVVNGLKAGIG